MGSGSSTLHRKWLQTLTFIENVHGLKKPLFDVDIFHFLFNDVIENVL